MTLIVRQAVLSDLDSLVPLFDGYRQFYGRAADLEAARAFLLARFQHNQSVIFVAEWDGQAVGFTQLYPSFSSILMGRTFVLNDLFVHPDHRRHGAGSQLLNAATEFARTVGAVRLTLFTDTANVTAQAVYQAGGWVRDEQYYVYNFAVKT